MLKKLQVVLIAMVLFSGLVPAASFASGATFSDDPSGYGNFAVANYTANPGSQNSWSHSISGVNPGDHVNFYYFYHNTGDATANQTQLNLYVQNSNNQLSARGLITALNTASVEGNANIYLSGFNGTASLTFSSATWYRNPNPSTGGNHNAQSLPAGQSGASVLTDASGNGGVSLGNVAAGEYGFVIFSFVVNDNGGGGCTVNCGGNNAPIAQTNSATNIDQNSATLNGMVNPNGDGNTSYWFEYGTNSNNLYNRTNSQSIGNGSYNQNVAQWVGFLNNNTTYYFRVVAQNSVGTTRGQILSFNTQGGGCTYNCGGNNAPTAQTNSATNIDQNSATLNGWVNPGNDGNTYYHFEYGTDSNNLFYRTSEQYIGSGSYNQNVSQFIDSLSNNTTYYFRVVAQNSNGTAYGNVLSFNTQGGGCTYNCGGNNYNAPTVQTYSANGIGSNYATLNGQVNANNSQATAWFEFGVNANSLEFTTNYTNINSGYQAMNFSQSVTNLQPGTTYYFRAVATNSYGTSRGQILSFVTYGSQSYGRAPIVNTRPVTYAYQNSAVLSGDVNPNGGVTTAWFEYGPTAALSLRSVPQPVGSSAGSVPISFASTGLIPGTTYYYRTVAQNQYGLTQGPVLTFRTQNYVPTGPVTPTTPTVIYRTKTVYVTSTESTNTGLACLVLTPSLDPSQLSAGNDFAYNIGFQNNCGFNLTSTNLRVILPVEVDFKDSSSPLFTRNGNELNYNLGTVTQGSNTSITVRGNVHSTVKKGDSLIFTSILNFTDNKAKFQSFSAYLTATVGDSGNGFLASLWSALGALFGDWLFWVLMLVIILFLVYFFTRRDGGEPDVKNIRVVS